MNIYFINCLLACSLAFWFGYWRGSKVTSIFYQRVLMGIAAEKVKLTTSL